ncbi:MAG: flavodoxin family protein [Bacteroides stercoris]
MDKGIKQVVILLAHPDIKSSQANKALMDAVKGMEEVAIYAIYMKCVRKILLQQLDLREQDYIAGNSSSCVSIPVILRCRLSSSLKKWQDEACNCIWLKLRLWQERLLAQRSLPCSEYSAYRSGGRNNFTMDETVKTLSVRALLHAGMVWQTPLSAKEWNAMPENIAEEQHHNRKIESLIGESGHAVIGDTPTAMPINNRNLREYHLVWKLNGA